MERYWGNNKIYYLNYFIKIIMYNCKILRNICFVLQDENSLDNKVVLNVAK